MTVDVRGTAPVAREEGPEIAEGRIDVDTTVDHDEGQTRRLETRRGVIKSVGGSALARFIVLPVGAILGILVTRLIIQNYGEATYAQYILLVGLGGLIPFADLGLSAAIMNAVAGAHNPRTDERLRATLISCMRILAACASIVILVAVVLYATGLWPTLLGNGLTPTTGPLAATLCLAVFGLNLLIAYGQRVLAALGLNVVVVLLGALQTPLVLLAIWLMGSFAIDGGYIPVAAYGATTVICILALSIASRKLRPMLRVAVRAAADPRERGGRVFNTTWPMLLQMIALPIAMSSDRLLLSLLGTVDELTEYSLANQLYSPVFAVVAAAGFALWPVFARARARGETAPVSPFRMSAVFTVTAGLACLSLTIAAGWLADIASDGTIELSVPVLMAFSAFIMLQSAKYPFGMYLTDPAGLRFQAFFILAMLPANLGLTLLLIPPLGAVGPIIGSIVGVALFQILPTAILVGRRMRTANAAA